MRRRGDWGRHFRFALLVAFLALAAAHNGNQAYLEAVDTWTAEKLGRVARATKEPRETVLWSARCERLRKDTLATRADLEPWKARCIERRVLQVKAPPA